MVLLASELEKTKTKKCPFCTGKSSRLFPIPARALVEWTNPVWSWSHGKGVKSMRHGDRLEKEFHEPDMEAKARQYAQEGMVGLEE